MNTREAKQIAVEWVNANAGQIPGFAGAFFGGSVNFVPDDAPWPSTSDIDIFIWADAGRTLSHIHHQNLLLEVSIFPKEVFDRDAEDIVADFRYAVHFSVPSLIMDPTGRLEALHRAVRREYPRKKWVQKRCQGAEERVHAVLNGTLREIGFEEKTVWGGLFTLYYAVFAAAEILALADLRNPTIRKAFVVSREVLEAHNQLHVQDSFLEVLGSAGMSLEQVEQHMREFRQAFDYASVIIRNPFFFSDKLHKESRSASVDGAQQIIDMGLHREAIYWIHFIRAIAQRAIQADAPESEKQRFQQAYKELLVDLGLETAADRNQRMLMVEKLLPRINEAADIVMRNNPQIIE